MNIDVSNLVNEEIILTGTSRIHFEVVTTVEHRVELDWDDFRDWLYDELEIDEDTAWADAELPSFGNESDWKDLVSRYINEREPDGTDFQHAVENIGDTIHDEIGRNSDSDNYWEYETEVTDINNDVDV